MRERLGRGEVEGALKLGEDDAEMSDDHQVGAGMGGNERVGGGVDTSAEFEPGFARGRAHRVGVVPEGAVMDLVLDVVGDFRSQSPK